MCRLFGLSSAPRRSHATFWLLDAPDSLAEQSHRDPDGTGLGYFDPDGTPQVRKAPDAAYRDREFAREAREVSSATFVAHIRLASTGGLTAPNTHPFEQAGRLFAHNGVVEELAALEAHLGPDLSLVRGETDSERVFALITRETRDAGGDLGAGIERATRWIASRLPLYALNFVLTTPDELWALRYPDTHELYVLEREAGGPHGTRHLDHSGTGGRMRVHSGDLADIPATVVASERMDEHPDWRLMEPGELLHVTPAGRADRRLLLPAPPARPLRLADLTGRAAHSQTAGG
ncbi:class II glutamine amidotransferase [Streptomyces xanthochromogenes]|uniref:class II glutamine amidotransferase n=1 Tax=Streptomyces xanthochromogenes TaxID=67384 RepID=UPI003796A4F4